MSTTPSTPGEQPEATQTTTDAGEQPQGDMTAALAGLSDEQALALIDGRSIESPEAAPAPEPEADPAPVIEGEQPPADPEPDLEPEPEPKPEGGHAKRIRLTGLQEADQQKVTDALTLVREGKASDIATAMKMVAGETAAPESPQGEELEPEPEATPSVLEALNSELEQLQAELAAAEDEYMDSTIKRPIQTKINAVNRQIAKEEIKAELAAERQQTEAGTYESEYRSAVQEVEDTFADAFDANPNFEKVLNALKAEAETSGDKRLSSPRFIVDLAKEAADILGIGKPAEPSQSPAPARPARAAKPVGATAPGHTHRAVRSKDQILADIDKLSLDEHAALVDRMG